MEIIILSILIVFTAGFVSLNAIIAKHKYDTCKECEQEEKNE